MYVMGEIWYTKKYKYKSGRSDIMEHSTGESGIKSLGGFAYQIKVFIYYLALLDQGEQIEFETIEDVNIRKGMEEIDEHGERYKCILNRKEANVAIQVKRTDISNAIAEKILYNWLLIEADKNNVVKYILFTDDEYSNKDIIFTKGAEEEYENIISKKPKRSDSLVARVKNIFEDKFGEFEKIYNEIKEKYKFKSISNLDELILNTYEKIFHRQASETIYVMRIEELLRYITAEIMKAVNNRNSFIFTYADLMNQVEEICERIGRSQIIINYSIFKAGKSINWDDLELVNSRECKQLNACKLSRRSIEQHLMYKLYYETSKCLYMENNKISLIDDIEDITYDNFESAKCVLCEEGQDKPIKRLEETKKRSNSYAINEQIRYGACIYLTREDIEDGKKISWEEDENA